MEILCVYEGTLSALDFLRIKSLFTCRPLPPFIGWYYDFQFIIPYTPSLTIVLYFFGTWIGNKNRHVTCCGKLITLLSDMDPQNITVECSQLFEHLTIVLRGPNEQALSVN